ncbi:MAG TPA: SRPBCC domain-containing protein, partial [Gammaproteobacteria bacterium]|nr:SRPBCC domain-containing protein [Gammaproteobacteria bacterium]
MAANPRNIRDVTVQHLCKARRDVVFRAWTDPKYLAMWWGPHGFDNPRCEADPRPGGQILIHMRGPDGRVYPMTGTYREIVKPQRIVFVSSPLDDKGKPMFEVLSTVSFAEEGDHTRVTVRAQVRTETAGAEQ